ncbi:MAG: hypothetical protein VKJ04_07345 [Vampirovibrionales bacterium]|nr:hypothetical protein [Vampirovibrionales bacterium]
MFKCKDCDSLLFDLVLQPEYQGSVAIRINEHQEVEVAINEQSFVADLMFMNQFALCKDCGSIKRWEYYFPNRLVGST